MKREDIKNIIAAIYFYVPSWEIFIKIKYMNNAVLIDIAFITVETIKYTALFCD